jgi:hypothetical protein
LHQKPFEVVKEHAHSEPIDFQLHTDRRAIERQDFEIKKTEKEMEIARLRMLVR